MTKFKIVKALHTALALSLPLTFAAGEARGEVDLSLPPELRNRNTRFEVAGQRSAG